MAVDTESKSLVSTEWLEAHLGQPDLRIVDATYYLPMQNKSARAEYDQRHIPGAVFFDVDEISDTSTDLPHMLPPADKFGSRMKKLGIGDGSRIVVYDGNGGIAAPRVWWTLRTSPANPTSPATTVSTSTGRSRKLLASATAMPRSSAGSATRRPPATFT